MSVMFSPGPEDPGLLLRSHGSNVSTEWTSKSGFWRMVLTPSPATLEWSVKRGSPAVWDRSRKQMLRDPIFDYPIGMPVGSYLRSINLSWTQIKMIWESIKDSGINAPMQV